MMSILEPIAVGRRPRVARAAVVLAIGISASAPEAPVVGQEPSLEPAPRSSAWPTATGDQPASDLAFGDSADLLPPVGYVLPIGGSTNEWRLRSRRA